MKMKELDVADDSVHRRRGNASPAPEKEDLGSQKVEVPGVDMCPASPKTQHFIYSEFRWAWQSGSPDGPLSGTLMKKHQSSSSTISRVLNVLQLLIFKTDHGVSTGLREPINHASIWFNPSFILIPLEFLAPAMENLNHNDSDVLEFPQDENAIENEAPPPPLPRFQLLLQNLDLSDTSTHVLESTMDELEDHWRDFESKE
ncbi:hypothetical protein F2Q69_00060901 [Brassica cretica]|uniref:Uncharacterized protein n=1 Tax=Brassica cretica TaxID=69181 RepID=A0A8S9RKN7_BRACR|nr:hypothetical protein F2Q69_00060901 [Brassica cretica]